MIKKIFAPARSSASINLALLVLRLWIGLSMLLNHGLGKLKDFNTMAPNFPDPLGIGHTASLALAVFAEFFASLLLIAGLVTRWSALVLATDMTVAFVGVHKTVLTGPHGGELAFLYLMGYVTLLLAGPGVVSLDKALFGKGGAKRGAGGA
ncbi:MAG: DoxX family protein [Verrucomicrobiota bacterium]|jgi:putative oxidoreductase